MNDTRRRRRERAANRRGGLRCALALCAVACAALLGGCRSKSKNFENENDELRRRVAALETERDAASARASEAEAKLREFVTARESVDEQEALEALPRVAGVSIGRLSGFADYDAQGRARSFDVYVRPHDGRMRFVQFAGRMNVEATLFDERIETGGAARRLGGATLGPADVRESYRASPLGVHYAVRLEFDEPVAADAGVVVVRVELIDPIGGQTHRAERLVRPAGRRLE